MTSQVSNPPIMRGIWITSGSDPYFPAQAARGDWARNLTIDGLRFQAEILTSVQPRTGSPISILGDDGRGYGWRADFSYAGVTNLGEDSGFVGLKIGGGCSDILVQNCLFEQYAKAINTSGATRLTVQQCEFSEICEDGVIIWGGTDLTFRYNIWTKSRGVSLQAAQAYGWDNAEPVHQDFFQIACNAASQYCDGLTISNNVMYDNTFRVHGVLLNNAYVGGSEAANVQGSRHRNVTIENNILFVTHTSAINMTNVYNLTCRRNKVVRSMTGNTGPNDVAMLVGKWGDPTSANNMANVTIANNVCRKYVGIAPHQDEADWTVSGNVESNAETVMPTGWVEIRPELVTTGRKAGRYGAA